MNPKPLVTNNNNNKQQYCNGCENNFPSSNCNFKEWASKIVSIIIDIDEYTWVYHYKYESKKENLKHFIIVVPKKIV
ncbi:unnamed protein product [Rhizophagus irregularis]|nr:unnamed protein product [Rhizophagus irregularis]